MRYADLAVFTVNQVNRQRKIGCCLQIYTQDGKSCMILDINMNVFLEPVLHSLLWPIFRQPHPDFINVRTACASEIWAQLTKNHLTKSSTERF